MSETPINPDQLTDDDLPVDFGRYTLTRVLGEGGMARVFLGNLAGPQGFSKPCAIKVLHSSVARRGEEFLLTLSDEARLGGLLNHPNVVNTYDFGNVGGQPFIAMEFIDGLGIDQLLAEVRRPPPEITLELGIQMCAGLEYAHNIQVDGEAGNLVHRDLKPSNVILSRNGVVKVMDFGIAKASNMTGNLTGIGMTKGTPPFMSPEQMAAEDLDRRSDIFAMGSLLFEIATGKRLFNESSISAVISSVMNVDRTLREGGRLAALDGIFPELKPILERCLAPAREDRYSSARAMAADLKRLQRSLPMGESLEDYVQAVLRGEVPPTPLDEDAPSPDAGRTADIATPVEKLPPIGTESVVIHFEESGETETIEARTLRNESTQERSSTEQLEPIPELVMEHVEDTPEEIDDEDSMTTQKAANALSGGTLVIGRTDSRIGGLDKLPRPATRTPRRRRKVRPPSPRARRFIKLAMALGLCLISLAAVLFILNGLSGTGGAKAPGDDPGDVLLNDPDADLTEQGSAENAQASAADKDAGGERRARKSRADKVLRAGSDAKDQRGEAGTDSQTASTTGAGSAGEEAGQDSEGRRIVSTEAEPVTAAPRVRPSPRESQRPDSRRRGEDGTSPPVKTLPEEEGVLGPTQVRPEGHGRVLKLDSAPREFFAGRRAKFRVSMPNHQSGDQFEVKMRMQCRSDGTKWRSYVLKQVGRNWWERPVPFEDRDRGICKYYFVARPTGKTRTLSGNISLHSKNNPYTITVR